MPSQSQGLFGLYKVPKAKKDYVPELFRGLFVGLIPFIIYIGWITQNVAKSLYFNPKLGKPMLGRFYSPAQLFEWFRSFNKPGYPPYVLHVFRDAQSHIVIGGVAALLVAIVAFILFSSQIKAKTVDTHGSAREADLSEIRAANLISPTILVKDPKNPKKKIAVKDDHTAVYIGGWNPPGVTSDPPKYFLRYNDDSHIIAFAPTRSGKGVGLVLPTLLSWQHSVLVHDIKGENWAMSAGWRQSIGQRVIKFDPAAEHGSARFNPLNEIRLKTLHETADVQNIVQMICDPEGKASGGQEAHWIATGSSLLVGTILHVLYSQPDKTLRGVAAFLANPRFESSEQMYEEMLDSNHDPENVMGWYDAEGAPTQTHPKVALSARDMLNKQGAEQSGVLSTALRFLTLYRDDIIANNTSTSDFSINDLMNAEFPVSLYLVVQPADAVRMKPLIRLMINQIFKTHTKGMVENDGYMQGNYKWKLLLLIDEFASLGRMEIVETSLAFIAGFGLKAYLIVQDLSQLQKEYGKDESIISNCEVRIAFAPNKSETAKMISELLGSFTMREHTKSSGKGGGKSHHDTSRQMAYVDEVMRLGKDNCLIFQTNRRVIAGKKLKFYNIEEFKRRSSIPAPDRSEVITESEQARDTPLLPLFVPTPPRPVAIMQPTLVSAAQLYGAPFSRPKPSNNEEETQHSSSAGVPVGAVPAEAI